MQSNGDSHPLSIAIVGAGIGGLAAALGLAQNGHTVTVFERSAFSSEVGAAVIITPNSYKCLRRLHVQPEDSGAVEWNAFLELDMEDRERHLVDVKAVGEKMGWGHGVLAHRARLHALLKAEALKAGVTLLTAKGVSKVDCEQGTITLDDGEQHSTDVVIGADGVHSVVRRHAVGAQYQPSQPTVGRSKKSAFRFMIPMSQAQADPQTAAITSTTGRCLTWLDDDRRIIMYPTSDHTELNFVCLHPSALSDTCKAGAGTSDNSRDEYNHRTSTETMLKVYERFPPIAKALLEKSSGVQNGLRAWNLLDLDELPTWVKGKTTLMGDAAHPVIPYGFSGASMAIEDAVSLKVLLGPGVQAQDVHDRLMMYESCRKARTAKAKDFSRERARDVGPGGHQDAKLDKVFFAYMFGHDEWEQSHGMLDKELARHNSAVSVA